MRILLLSDFFPYPADNGAKIRIYNLLRALGQRHTVTLITFANVMEENNTDEVRKHCQVSGIVPEAPFVPTRARALLGFLSPIPRSIVDTYTIDMAHLIQGELEHGSHDVLIASHVTTAHYVRGLQRVPSIIEEVETSVIRDACVTASSLPVRLRKSLTWSKTQRYLRKLLRHFDVCTVASEAERANLGQVSPNLQRVEVVPNGVDTVGLVLNDLPAQPNTLVFNGALTFSANYDAVRFFLSEIWQRIKTGEPSAHFKITGRSAGVDLSSLCLGDGVQLTGYLRDIRPTVAGAWACVVPLRIGGGTRLKILEAMALGTPVVATSKGAEGLDVTAEENILIADEPAEFAAQVVRLLRDSNLRRRLSENARRLVETKYSWRMIGEQFNQLVESVAEKGKAGRC